MKNRLNCLMTVVARWGWLVAAVTVSVTAAAQDAFILQTKNTSLVIRREGDTWRLKHYGERVADAASVGTVAWRGAEGYNSLGQRQDAAYSVFGAANLTPGINKAGGLQVTHANGSLTTDPIAEAGTLVADKPGVTHLVLRERDRQLPFYIVQHFRAIESCDIIETWVELRHEESGIVRLGKMDSLALTLPHVADEFHLLQLTAQWGGEGQVVENRLLRGQTLSFGARSGVRDAWGANPSFMLSIGSRANETSGRVLAGTLCWGGTWKIEVERDPVDLLEIRAGADALSAGYVLDPGKTLTLPKVALTFSDRGKGQASRNFHRWALTCQMPAGDKVRPVLLNSWEGSLYDFTESTLTNMMAGVAWLGGEMFVLDDGWFGNGAYQRNHDRAGLGDWQTNTNKLPRGLDYLVKEAEKRKLKFGLWVEPEMANTESELLKQHPNWALKDLARPLRCGRGKTQVVLDFANPEVVEAIYRQLDALYGSTPGLAYIKWDANCDIHNPGSLALGADRQGNVWFDYTQGLYSLLSRLRAKYPTMDIQACSSGGGHMDYGFLGYADEFWTSDDTDARERVFIQWGASHFYPAAAMASHVTVSPNIQTKRSTPLKFRFDVAMSGRLGFELLPSKMTQEESFFARRAVNDYKRIRSVVQQGDLYRLRSPFEGNHAALMYVNEEKTRSVVFLYGLSRALQSDWVPPLRLEGLDPKVNYRIREIDIDPKAKRHSPAEGTVVEGASLMAVGLPVTLEGDWDSAIFEVVAAPKVAPPVSFEVVSKKAIRTHDECLNFCFATDFGNGRLSLSHSIGIHQVTERGSHLRSEDGGKTWNIDEKGTFPAMNAFVTKSGLRRCVEGWNAPAKVHEITITTEEKPGKLAKKRQKIPFPFEVGLHIHREVLRLKDGRLLLTAYGMRKDFGQHVSFFLESLDDGESWHYLSSLPAERSAAEGLNESTVVELKSGRLLAMARSGSVHWGDSRRGHKAPLVQYASDDGGRTWKDRREIAEKGVTPVARLLSDGSLVVLSGRPGVFLLFDPTGTGESYRQVTVYDQPGSACSSIFEFKPGELTLIYDESQFCSHKIASPTNSIIQLTAKYHP